MGRSLHDHSPSDPAKTNGWSISKYRWFMYIMSGMFVSLIELVRWKVFIQYSRFIRMVFLPWLDLPRPFILHICMLDCTEKSSCQSAIWWCDGSRINSYHVRLDGCEWIFVFAVDTVSNLLPKRYKVASTVSNKL